MRRREFFSRLIPFGDQAREHAPQATSRPEEVTAPPTEKELFLRAMAMGIDPATLTPGQLETLISESEPSTTL
ncbi:hypothetical protein LF599_02680 [Pseudodesulfovibrio thermohalotolerans]|jgi:hypothetical protein|uniref:hypothetical protein n=1 Tax=Pseudodesulfovibrio thermohalotolerans TaxID=2880651 RepID=UPI002441B453|nr:hypothetical protein [Pseudodesulfovibrio thermohalotolerans]WFS63083.1 hypothetical protein LF599_02680 [Pseudodesulfovibrio thermohalotolerans]